MRMRVRSGCQQGKQRDGDEVAEGRLRPMHLSSAAEPRRLDEKDDGRDRDLAEPADYQEQRGENDAPEAKFGKSDSCCKVEHVPGEPEDQRSDQDHEEEDNDRESYPAGDESADPESAKHDVRLAHAPSLRRDLRRAARKVQMGAGGFEAPC